MPDWIGREDMPNHPHAWYWAEYPGQWVWYSPEHNQERGIDHGTTRWMDLMADWYWGPFTAPPPNPNRQ